MTKRNQELCVLGLGYIGLPTASLFATNGFKVTGVDVNIRVVDLINQGAIHIEEPGLSTLVQAATNSGMLSAALRPVEADVFIIAVPTPITANQQADMSFVAAAANAILPVLRPGNLVILESTSPPGTTTGLLASIFAKSGLELGKDLYLAHCPERVLPGQILYELIENHRVIGGFTPACAEIARDLYASIVKGDIHVTDATTAEMVKVMENTYRDVNIALANELATIAEKVGANAWEIIRLANLHPRVNLHQPGPGVGGHCISVDPWFLVEMAPKESKLIHTARTINNAMPEFVVRKIEQLLPDPTRAKIAVLGAAYKGNVDDTRESPAIEVVHLLNKAGYNVAIHDPHVNELEYELFSAEDALDQADCVLLLTSHDEFKALDPKEFGKIMKKRLLVDTRNFLDKQVWKEANFQVHTLGDNSAGVLELIKNLT